MTGGLAIRPPSGRHSTAIPAGTRERSQPSSAAFVLNTFAGRLNRNRAEPGCGLTFKGLPVRPAELWDKHEVAMYIGTRHPWVTR
jgi:hypothetical protein